MAHPQTLANLSTTDLTQSLGFTTHVNTKRKPWTPPEDELLISLVHHYGAGRGKTGKWDKIAAYFDDRKAKDCRKRWINSLDPNLRKGKWTTDEDKILKSAYEELGPAWYKICLRIPGRTDDQCAKRYNEVLDPSTQTRLRPWTEEEDQFLIESVRIHGTRWKNISLQMRGRTALTCRNRWRRIVADVVKGKRDVSTIDKVNLITNTSSSPKVQNNEEEEEEEEGDGDIDGDIQMTDSATPSTSAFPTLKGRDQDRNSSSPITVDSDLFSLGVSRSSSTSSAPQASTCLRKDQQSNKTPIFPISKSKSIPSVISPNLPSSSTSASVSVSASPLIFFPSSVPTNIEYKYTLESPDGSTGIDPSTLPNISSEKEVESIIQRVKELNLTLVIHQHLHYDHNSTSTAFNSSHVSAALQGNIDNINHANNNQSFKVPRYSTSPMTTAGSFNRVSISQPPISINQDEPNMDFDSIINTFSPIFKQEGPISTTHKNRRSNSSGTRFIPRTTITSMISHIPNVTKAADGGHSRTNSIIPEFDEFDISEMDFWEQMTTLMSTHPDMDSLAMINTNSNLNSKTPVSNDVKTTTVNFGTSNININENLGSTGTLGSYGLMTSGLNHSSSTKQQSKTNESSNSNGGNEISISIDPIIINTTANLNSALYKESAADGSAHTPNTSSNSINDHSINLKIKRRRSNSISPRPTSGDSVSSYDEEGDSYGEDGYGMFPFNPS